MSGLEGMIFGAAAIIIWLLVSIRDTLKDCLQVLREIRSKN